MAMASAQVARQVQAGLWNKAWLWGVTCWASALGLAACERPQRPQPHGPGVTAEAKAATVEQVPKPKDLESASQLTPEQQRTVVATIGERQITLGDLEARINREPPVLRSQLTSIQRRMDYLQKWVQFEVLAQEARRQGLDKDPEVIEQLQQAMVRRYLLEVGKAEVKTADITEAECRQYYDANPGLYHKPEQVELSHILFKTEAEARKVADELRAGAEGNAGKLVGLWNDYVVRLSQDKATAPYLGALGLVSKTPVPGQTTRSPVPPAVVDAAMAMKPFEVGPIVQSEAGWHVLMATGRSPAVDKTFDEVKDSIRPRIVKRERDLRRQKLLDELRARTKVELNEDALRALPVPQPPATGPATKDAGKSAAPTPTEVEEPTP
jgi:peptidyl-prolyl cis-trans isomerase C